MKMDLGVLNVCSFILFKNKLLSSIDFLKLMKSYQIERTNTVQANQLQYGKVNMWAYFAKRTNDTSRVNHLPI